MTGKRTKINKDTVSIESSNKRKRDRDSLDASVQFNKRAVPGNLGVGARVRFKNPFTTTDQVL
jgi:hypothetical protein